IWSFATAINKLLFDKNCHICNSYQKGARFYQSHKVFYTTHQSDIVKADVQLDQAVLLLSSSNFDKHCLL
ncbi:hypothetical protein B5G00_16820, partial [Blautia sp. An46]